MDKVNNYVLVTIIALLILAIMIIIHNYKYNRISENELNLSDKNNPKTNGGYTDSIFNALNITPVAFNKYIQNRHDTNMKILMRAIFGDDSKYILNTSPTIPYDPTVTFRGKETDIHEVLIRYLDFPDSFTPDSSTIIKEFNNTIFIFEFDEGENFHTDLKNINYIKKTLNYNNMILHNKPSNISFVIVRITYTTKIDKETLVKLVIPILKYIRKYAAVFISLLAGTGYILVKIKSSDSPKESILEVSEMVLVDKYTMNEFVTHNEETDTDVAKKTCININDLYNRAIRDSRCDTKGTQLRNAPITYDQIMDDTPIEMKRIETTIAPILGGSSHVPYCDEELDTKQLFEMMTRYRRDIIKSFAYNSMWIGFFTSLYKNDAHHLAKHNLELLPYFDDIFNEMEEQTNFTISDYDYSEYAPSMGTNFKPDYIENGRRTLYKKLIEEALKILINTNEYYHDRLVLLNSLILTNIRCYENWFSMYSYKESAHDYCSFVCHATDDLYKDIYMNEMIKELSPFVIPELVERVHDNLRIMNNDDVWHKGKYQKLSFHENVSWNIPDVTLFNQAIINYARAYYHLA